MLISNLARRSVDFPLMLIELHSVTMRSASIRVSRQWPERDRQTNKSDLANT